MGGAGSGEGGNSMLEGWASDTYSSMSLRGARATVLRGVVLLTGDEAADNGCIYS